MGYETDNQAHKEGKAQGQKANNGQTEPQQRNTTKRKLHKGIQTMNTNENANSETANKETAKPNGKARRKARKAANGKAKTASKTTAKSATDKTPSVALLKISKVIVALLETLKAVVRLPQFAKAFGGEVQAIDLPRIQVSAKDNPQAFAAFNTQIGHTERMTPLRLKKAALLTFCQIHGQANPDFQTAMSESVKGAPLSSLDKFALTLACFTHITAYEFAASYKAYSKVLNGDV